MKNLIASGIVCAAAMLVCPILQAVEPCQNCAPCNCGYGGCQCALSKHDMATKGDVWAQRRAAYRPWHGKYYYLPYGQPTALVVPPTGIMQTNYSWGVSQNTMTPVYHQFGPSAMPSPGGAFYGTPVWPSHTDQFGLYSVRAPW